MRRLFLRWLKTQWTAVPLAFLIVTAVEIWRVEDGTTGSDDDCRCPKASEPVAGPPPANAARPPTDQLPSTKSPSKIDRKPADESQKLPKDVVIRVDSATNETRSEGPLKRYGQDDIVVNTSRPVVNPHPFKYLINCPDLCRGVDVFLLNYVHTAVNHFSRRDRIRKTWALQSHYRNFTIRTVFFVGLTNKSSWFQDALFYESKKYGDIVQKDFLDTYR